MSEKNATTNKQIAKPFIRWAGSKRKLVHKLATFWGAGYPRYIEPFMGSACLFFSLAPQRAILSDVNEELVETFNLVREKPDLVYDALISIPRSRFTFGKMRATSADGLTPLQRSIRFLYLNRFCFNGLYRTNREGRFNVPFAKEKTGGFPSRVDFVAASELLSSAKILQCDFETTIWEKTKGNDFIYLDPPYAVSGRRVFSEYGPGSFVIEDLWRLSESLDEINRRGAYFVLSYAEFSEAKKLFGRWSCQRVSTQRNIAGFSSARRKASETIYSNIPNVFNAQK